MPALIWADTSSISIGMFFPTSPHAHVLYDKNNKVTSAPMKTPNQQPSPLLSKH
jgi:hypothetical protein